MKKLFTILALILFLSSPNILKASHFAGADLTYTCMGGNTYRITYSFYRDCSGVAAPSTISINFSCSSNSAYNFSVLVMRIPGTGQEITSSCSASPTSCGNGNNFGVEEYIYQGQVTLIACNEWTMSYSSGARNPITTVPNNSSNNWFTQAKLNNLSAPSNSSPSFSNKPIVVVCSNQSFCLNHGALDPDGDSLVYSFYGVNTNDAASSVIYSSTWSYANFLTAQGPAGITINSVTGDICFTATQDLITVFGVKVEEYRKINGIATNIGTVYRDMELLVTTCNNSIPTLSGIDTTLSASYNPNDTIYSLNLCISPDPIEFHISGFDADTFNSAISGNPEKFSISWNNGIPAGTFTTYNNGTDSAYASFSWQPTFVDVGNTKCFTASIKDEACPYNGVQSFSYCILVQGLSVEIGSDTTACEGESIIVKAIADSSTVNYLWSIDGNPMGNPPSQDSIIFNSSTSGLGQHIITIETNDGSTTTNCPGVDEVEIDVVFQPQINGVLPDTTICNFQTVTYDAGPGQLYLWTDSSNNPVGNTQTFTTNYNNIYFVKVDGGINTRCYDTDTFEVIVPLVPPAFSFGPDVTIGQSQTLVLDMPPTPSTHYLWSTGDTTQSITIDSSFNWINQIIGQASYGNQCYSADTIYVFIGSVGMEENSESPLKIYPNPVDNAMKIELDKAYANSNIEVLDMNGKVVLSTRFSGKDYELKNLEQLPKGVYLLRVQNKELNVLLRFVKE